MLAALAVPSGVWGASMDDVTAEMAKSPSPWWGRVPMMVTGTALIPMTDLCLYGGVLRPIASGASTIDLGPTWPDNQHSVQVYLGNAIGDELFLYERKASLPDCK